MKLPSSPSVTLFAIAFLAIAGLALVGLFTYIRLAPEDPNVWHVALQPVEGEADAQNPVMEKVARGVVAFVPARNPVEKLAQLVQVAGMAPRVYVLQGSIAEGRITFVARSRLMGFPDYITAEITDTGLRIFSRQRFGSNDLGVNAKRLTDWLARL